VLAEWIIEGQTEWDMWDCDPRRYTDYTDHDYCIDKAMEVYGHEYAMHFPHHEWPAGRDRKLSALHAGQEAAGAVFGAYNGWERANWLPSPAMTRPRKRPRPGSARALGAARARGMRSGARWRGHARSRASPGSRSKGPGARAYVDSLTARACRCRGAIGLAYFADSRGAC
jgi:dimethylglycine dehydrogenase